MSIPTVKVPKFTTTLPVSGDKIEFRPFLVKEEKILLLAAESSTSDSMVSTMADIVESCTFGKVKIDDYGLADMQWLFLQLRAKSISEEIEFRVMCGDCNHAQLQTLNVTEFETRIVESADTLLNIGEIKVEMKYPTLRHYALLFEDERDEAVYEVIADCVKKIYDDTEMFVNDGSAKQEIYQFLNSLTVDQYRPFEDFFTTMPILIKNIEFTCQKCGRENEIMVDSLQSFFG